MSKRLQILLDDSEYKELQRASRREKKTVASWVRQRIRGSLQEQAPEDPDKKLARILRFAKYSGPTGDIETLLAEVEKGRQTE